jgi:hypothetical protein
MAPSGNIRLAKWFIEEIQALPNKLNGCTLQEYFRFF